MATSRKYVLLWWGGAFHDKPARWHISIFHLYRHTYSSFMQCTNEELVCLVLRYTACTAGLIYQTYTYLFWVCKTITFNTWEGHLLITYWFFILFTLFPKINVYIGLFLWSTPLIRQKMWKHGLKIVHEPNTKCHYGTQRVILCLLTKILF